MAHDAWFREACRAIEGVVESVFAQVAAVRALVLARHAWAAGAGEHFSDSDVSGLAPALRQLLARPDQLAVGLGVILQPGLLPTHPLRLEWWQLHPDRSRPAPLEVDLHPNSLNFYDYATAGWFAVPRRTRRRHIVGPYVDVHGTDRYLLTLTMPLEVDGAFLGVAGADVPMGGFESVVLRALGPSCDAVVVNDEGRVVVSTSSLWITGTRLADEHMAPSEPMTQVPWRIMRPS